MAINIPEPIDSDGTINVRSGGSFVGALVSYADRDAVTGQINDVSAVPLFFEVAALDIRKALPVNPANARGRLFPDLSVNDLAGLGDASWAIWDETAGHRQFVFGGRIRSFT